MNTMKLSSPQNLLLSFVATLCFSGSALTQNLQVLHRFEGADGINPMSSLIPDQAGNLYGTTEYGGETYYGTVFELSPPAHSGGQWLVTRLYSFQNTGDGARPIGGLVFDSKGNLYGTASDYVAGGYGEVFQLTPPATPGGAWTETVLWHFTGGMDGDTPRCTLLIDEEGNLYGTTFNSVFKLSPPAQAGGAWGFTLLHELSGGTNDGRSSQAGLVRDPAGNLYGTTLFGGYIGNNNCGAIGCGTVFEVSPPAGTGGGWTEQVIHYLGVGNDGFDPEGGLTIDANGNLYGTTYSGGPAGGGMAFALSPPSQTGGAWTETLVHGFSYTNSHDGAAPAAALILDAAGNLYGTTMLGGNLCYLDYTPYGCGTVFKLSPPQTAGGPWTENILYFFQTGVKSAKQPEAGLFFDSAGNLYGTTAFGGSQLCNNDGSIGCGSVFKLAP